MKNGTKNGHAVAKRNRAQPSAKPARRRPAAKRLNAKQLAAAEKAARAAALKLMLLGPGHFCRLD